ncbi:SEC10/PgrA surface exclusion domain-containing protein [Streptococcus vestibularis]|uniref:SEC10/PgrA surface exclusion domain-containing protein n=1 Tax=Streptococcus vestibularis TaxID=1343 RepID=UPI00241CF470|nr:SEC10/PgrA surface exclusion domain-containing protein [Streptococcus vestibularis]
MNKKVLATAGIAALAVSASVAKADEVTTNGQVSITASVSSTATQAIPTQSQVETAREQANAANQAKAAYETAQTVANEKAVALAAVEAAKKKAEASTTNIRQKFTVSSEYISALKIYESRTSTAEEKYQAEQTLKDVNKRDRENNKYQDNEADKNITISDLNNLSEAQITDLSLYASSLINQIRTAFGTTQTSVSKGSVMATDRVTDGYVADNWGWESISNRRHDSAALACAGKSFNTVNIGENLNTWQGLTGPFTLNEIKEYIYEAMLDFMFNGQEWNHARSIAGLTSDGGETYIGTDLSVVAGAFNVHVNNINENSISFDSSFDTTKIANPYVGSQSQPSLNANLAAAKVAYETAKQANDQAQSDLASKKVASESATLKLKNTQSELTALKATASKLAAAQTNLSEKQAALKQALAFAKNRVAALTNASANLAKAKAERAIAFAKLTAAKGALSTERAKLVELSAKRDKLMSEYTTVQTAFDNYMKAKADKERQTQLSKEFAKITSKGLTPVSIYDVDGKVVALTTQEQAAQTVAQVPVNYGQTKAEKQAPVQEADSLPETGESTASGFSLVGLFMTLLAFLGFVDRRTRRN